MQAISLYETSNFKTQNDFGKLNNIL